MPAKSQPIRSRSSGPFHASSLPSYAHVTPSFSSLSRRSSQSTTANGRGWIMSMFRSSAPRVQSTPYSISGPTGLPRAGPLGAGATVVETLEEAREALMWSPTTSEEDTSSDSGTDCSYSSIPATSADSRLAIGVEDVIVFVGESCSISEISGIEGDTKWNVPYEEQTNQAVPNTTLAPTQSIQPSPTLPPRNPRRILSHDAPPTQPLNDEYSYILLVLELVCTRMKRDDGYRRIFNKYRRSPTPFQDCVRYCTSEEPGLRNLADNILCAMQEEDGSEGQALAGRMLMKFSQHTSAIPSSLFVQDVECDQKETPAGLGGYADVFRGTRRGSGVALKRLRLAGYQGARAEKWQKPFFREALLWHQLRHSNILPLIGLDQQTFVGSICMISPWMQNGNIATYLSRTPETDIHPRCTWIREIVEGLTYLHDQGVVHGDLRGANVLLDDMLHTRISDFGLSVLVDAGSTTMGVSTWHQGAVRWMAAEVIDSGKCTKRGDIYSFGCVCLEILTGEYPFPELQSSPQITRAICDGKRPDWPTHADATVVGLELGKTARQCWEHDPEQRPTIQELRTGITKVNGLLKESVPRGIVEETQGQLVS